MPPRSTSLACVDCALADGSVWNVRFCFPILRRYAPFRLLTFSFVLFRLSFLLNCPLRGDPDTGRHSPRVGLIGARFHIFLCTARESSDNVPIPTPLPYVRTFAVLLLFFLCSGLYQFVSPQPSLALNGFSLPFFRGAGDPSPLFSNPFVLGLLGGLPVVYHPSCRASFDLVTPSLFPLPLYERHTCEPLPPPPASFRGRLRVSAPTWSTKFFYAAPLVVIPFQ